MRDLSVSVCALGFRVGYLNTLVDMVDQAAYSAGLVESWGSDTRSVERAVYDCVERLQFTVVMTIRGEIDDR